MLSCTACLPSQPNTPPVGIRMNAGVIELALPLCEGEIIESAKLIPNDPDRELDPVWSAEQFKGDPTGVVRLDSKSWTAARGGYGGLVGFGIDVLTDRRATGLGLDDVRKYVSSDMFYVNDVEMSLDDYRQEIMSQISCGGDVR